MIRIENTDVHGWEAAIRGLRNPMNSWAKSDSKVEISNENHYFELGDADKDLCLRMNCHSEESKYRRMIIVTMDVVAPLYWWKEYDTYKVGTVANSCSTMHKIHAKEFGLDDFSHEHLIDEKDGWIEDENGSKRCSSLTLLETIINTLNAYRFQYLQNKDKKYWWQMIQLLPTSYNQRRTLQLNYEVLSCIYRQRKSHKLTEWHAFCNWIKTLPYSELITGEQA